MVRSICVWAYECSAQAVGGKFGCFSDAFFQFIREQMHQEERNESVTTCKNRLVSNTEYINKNTKQEQK